MDRDAPIRFIRTAYEPEDWLGVLLKANRTGEAAQRVVSVTTATSSRFQAWLRHKNAHGWNVYVSVNAIEPHSRSRARVAVRSVRHLFLDVDHDSDRVVEAIGRRKDLPIPSYVLGSSTDRTHILWRVTGFDRDDTERVQKHLARQLDTDSAATSCTQTTRLPGFRNHKYRPPPLVTAAYDAVRRVYGRFDFPLVPIASPNVITSRARAHGLSSRVERARRYLAARPPAIAGQHGDLHTFRTCCRIVRGFALDDEAAMRALAGWNATCQPPWTERELLVKCHGARRYGREPIGGLLE